MKKKMDIEEFSSQCILLGITALSNFLSQQTNEQTKSLWLELLLRLVTICLQFLLGIFETKDKETFCPSNVRTLAQLYYSIMFFTTGVTTTQLNQLWNTITLSSSFQLSPTEENLVHSRFLLSQLIFEGNLEDRTGFISIGALYFTDGYCSPEPEAAARRG